MWFLSTTITVIYVRHGIQQTNKKSSKNIRFINRYVPQPSQMLNCTFHKQNSNKAFTTLLHYCFIHCVNVFVSCSTTVNERYRPTNDGVIYDTQKYRWEIWIISTDQFFLSLCRRTGSKSDLVGRALQHIWLFLNKVLFTVFIKLLLAISKKYLYLKHVYKTALQYNCKHFQYVYFLRYLLFGH